MIERFRLEERIGTDADAAVWRATDQLLCRTVIIHVLGSGPKAAGMADAIRAAARVTDPRVARIFDAGYAAGHPYVVSEWAPGSTLEQQVSIDYPEPALAAAIVADAADALAIAHQTGIPHLCLGPRSLRWGTSGVKVTGLGIESALRQAKADDPAATDTRALARMLYALLTGYWPGDEPTVLPTAPQRRGQWYAPRQVRAGVPGGLNAITTGILQPECARPRISAPADLAAALHQTVPAAHSLSRQIAIRTPKARAHTTRIRSRRLRLAIA